MTIPYWLFPVAFNTIMVVGLAVGIVCLVMDEKESRNP